jgi:aerobic carbon-monoxide dehydrogenase small subunit
MQTMQLRVNEVLHEIAAPAHTRLAEALRLHISLTGTNQACDTAQCGACTVLADGKAIKSCNVLALQMQGRAITTIEGLSGKGQALHAMQQAFLTHEALQCGYCTPGMILRAISMAQEGVAATPEAVRHALAGNICRCTGYDSIVKAICAGLDAMRAPAAA